MAVEKLVNHSLVTILRHLAPNMGLELEKQTEEASDPTVRAEDTVLMLFGNDPEDVAINRSCQSILSIGKVDRPSDSVPHYIDTL